MKKVFFGVLLAMADLATWVMMLMLFLPIGQQVSLVFGLVVGLCSALGYWLIMRGAEELPQTQFWYYAGLFSKILCAYTAAMTILDAVQQLGLFTLHLPAMVENILYYVTDLGSFFVMYFCVLGVRDLQYVARKNLFAGEIYKCFTAWVVIRLLASLIFQWLYVIAIGAYVVMLVYYGRAAWAYDKRNPYQQD
jgi:hypothetical protein